MTVAPGRIVGKYVEVNGEWVYALHLPELSGAETMTIRTGGFEGKYVKVGDDWVYAAALVDSNGDVMRLDANEASLKPPPKSGTYIDASRSYGGSPAATVFSADTIYGGAFAVERPITVDTAAFAVTVAATAGNSARVGLGVLSFDTDWLVEDVQEIFETLIDSTGAKTNAFAFTFEPGIVYVPLFHPQANVTIRSITGGQPVYGNTSIDDANMRDSAFVAQTYGALPESVALATGYPAHPRIGFRVA